ncbi:MAG TPA: sulfotransferase domain-containing protein, partial [Acidimicrobiia bacterium]|nr:sulfotransferase domain-containing protein [Acidimicrobiia bacterium]
VRTPTSGTRLLPDFIVIGTQRGGTSSLFKYLSFHPEIAPSLRKEVDYFTRFVGERSLGWYKAHFPLARQRRRAEARGSKLLTFEATPTYLDHPHTPRQVAELMPDVKLIALLRDPIARALSHHQHMSRLKLETIPFPQAIRFEEERIKDELARVFADPHHYSRPYTRLNYAYRGFYDEHLERWFDHFDRDRFLFLRSEDFYSDPSTVLGQILDFVGVDASWRPSEFANFSYRGKPPVRYDDMDPATRAYLEEKFAPHNQRLVELLGPEFAW